MLSSGVSFPRIMWPYFLAATMLAAMSLFVNHTVLPAANKVRLAFEEEHIRVAYHVDQKNIHREIEPGVIAYFESWNAEHQKGFRFSLERWKDDALISKLTSDRAEYDSVNGSWQVYDYLIRDMNGNTETIRRGARLDTTLHLLPSDMGQRWETSMAMSWSELNDYIAAKNAQGDDSIIPYLIEKHQRTSYPFATYVFTLIGVSIASRKVRGGTGLHLAAGVGLVLLYIFAMKLTTVAATNAGLDPFIAVWMPNVIFAVIGVVIYRRAPK
jgi:lipopolysaccharide export system permease protein